MPAIEVSALTKRFGDVTAIEDLSFTVDSGEVFGFLGANGAGKSTTINILLGYMTPTDGSATVLGHDVETASRRLRARTGVLPENASVYQRLTGREHVESAIRMKDADDDPDKLLSRVGLEKAAWDRAAGGYSTGMAQRLALATALAGDPDLLVLDEPQSGLDHNGMQQIRDIVEAEADSGTTVFFSSHILPEVEAVSDRVGMMRDGQMAALDSVGGLREQYGGGTELVVTMTDSSLEQGQLTTIDGITDVEIDGVRVTATCRHPRAKVDLLTTLERTGRVADFTVHERSLGDLFTTVTAGDDATDGETGRPSAHPVEVSP
jgi:ABC-2 type transport system ATP-binding protein